MPIPIALQLYSVRNDCAADLFSTIEKVAKMGYVGVEFAGYHGHDAASIRACLDANGLVAPSTHCQFDLLQEDKIEATMEFHKTVGIRDLIVPWLPESMRDSEDACKATADRFMKILETLEPAGFRTGFHCHEGDMRPLPSGKSAWDLIATHTSNAFIMQYDTANGMHGGADPVQPILDWPGRGQLVHLKEYSGEHGAKVIGEGQIPWARVFEAAESVAGVEWYVVEHEAYEGMTPLEAVEQCLKNLRAMGK